MMHDRFDSLVDLLLAGGLDDAERREAEGHAASCSPCGALLLDARSFRAWATGAIRLDAPPADLEDRIIARFRAATGAKPRRSWPRLGRVFKVVGGLAAAVLLIVLGSTFTERDHVPAGFLPEMRAKLVAQSGVEDTRATRWQYWSAPANGRRDLTLAESRGTTGNQLRLGAPSTSAAEGLDIATNPSFALEGAGVDVMNRANARTADGSRIGRVDSGTYAPHGDLHSHLKDLSGRVYGEASEAESLKASGDELNFPSPALGLAVPRPVAPEPPKPNALAKLADADTRVIEKLGAEKLADPVPFQAGRKLIRNADMTVEVETYDAALTKINAIVAEEKGFVASADTERMANGKISATVTLRIPPERFEAVIERFRALGTVRHQSISSQDVTKAYVDLESRLGSKQALLERLKKVLAEAKGTVKELMEVEVQMGKTLEEIESIKGELKYLDNQVGLSTIILRLAEKDLGQPFEVVQTLQAAIGITSPETEAVYVRAQKVVTDAGGQVIDSNLVRSKDGSARGTIKAKVDAEKFPALREELRKLGHVDVDTVIDRKTARGGQEGPAKPDAPVRKEQAVITLSIATPPIHVARRAQVSVETADVEGAYLAARKSVEAAGGKVLGGSVTGRTDGMSANLTVQVDVGKFLALLEGFRASGKVLTSTSSQAVPPAEGALVQEKGEIELVLTSPPVLIGEQHGIVRTIRETFAGSWAGLLWSIEKLFVGISLAGPWIAILAAAWFVWRRVRRKKAPQQA